MNISKKWFSVIEIIISLAILIIISVIAVTYNTKMVDKSNNSKIISDITTLENSLTSYKNDTSKIPNPSWNLKYFKDDTSYAHDESEAFWVSWFITEKTIPAKYINYLPVDPKNWQYYAIWKTFNDGKFELAWAIKSDWKYQTKVNWTWDWVNWPYNLIREYNWPNFVYDKSLENFPYNPDELLLTAKISSFSWNVSINSKVLNNEEILNFEIREWDKIKVSQNWFIELYLSDWSYSVIWDTESDSEITLSNMRYTQKNNLFTNVKIILNMWNIWTKAPKLWENSEYEIYTTDTVAAVRWTVFWLRKAWNNTSISVLEWKVEVSEITNNEISWENSDALENYIKNWKEDLLWIENVWEIPWVTNSWWVIEVSSWENIKSLKFNKDASTWTSSDQVLGIPESESSLIIEKIPKENRDKIKENDVEINNAINLEILEIKNDNAANRSIKIKLNNILKKWNIVKINWDWKTWLLPTENNVLVLSWSMLNKNIINLSICRDNNCSKVKKIDFSKQISYKDEDLGEQESNENDDLNSDEKDAWVLKDTISFDNDLKSDKWLNYEKWYITSRINETSNNNNELKSLSPERLTTEESTSIYKLWDIKWLFLDNIQNDDFVKYNVSELDLWEDYTIEMSVRWWALNRRDNKIYTLFDADSVKLWIFNWKLCSWIWKTSCSNYYKNEYGNEIQISNSFKSDKFYKIFFTNTSGWVKIKITDLDDESNIYYEGRIKSSSILMWEWLFVWSTKEFSWEYFNQWNDIIDYVKIYVKK